SIQSAVGWAERGTATSAMLFMRFLGQSLGVALFGAVFNQALFANAVDPDAVDRLMEPSLRSGLDPALSATLTGEIAAALHQVYLIGLVLALATLGLTLLMPRGHSPHREQDGEGPRPDPGRKESRPVCTGPASSREERFLDGARLWRQRGKPGESRRFRVELGRARSAVSRCAARPAKARMGR